MLEIRPAANVPPQDRASTLHQLGEAIKLHDFSASDDARALGLGGIDVAMGGNMVTVTATSAGAGSPTLDATVMGYLRERVLQNIPHTISQVNDKGVAVAI